MYKNEQAGGETVPPSCSLVGFARGEAFSRPPDGLPQLSGVAHVLMPLVSELLIIATAPEMTTNKVSSGQQVAGAKQGTHTSMNSWATSWRAR
jgi:hypothetical protein